MGQNRNTSGESRLVYTLFVIVAWATAQLGNDFSSVGDRSLSMSSKRMEKAEQPRSLTLKWSEVRKEVR